MDSTQRNKHGFQPDCVLSYFQMEWKVLLIVTVSGLIYNLGLLAGPWFEGQMTGCLVNILQGCSQFNDMLVLDGLTESAREGLEHGYDTMCTPEIFSQGQWQLLSIARAVAA